MNLWGPFSIRYIEFSLQSWWEQHQRLEQTGKRCLLYACFRTRFACDSELLTEMEQTARPDPDCVTADKEMLAVQKKYSTQYSCGIRFGSYQRAFNKLLVTQL